MKQHYSILALLLALLLVLPLALSGCGKTEVPDVVRIATLKGPTGMGMAPLMTDAADGKTEQSYHFSLEGAPDAVNALVIAGEVDIAAVPVNVASILYNKTNGGVRVAGINTLGVLYLVEKGESIGSIADLRGKTICAAGQGATPEYILNHVLTQNGLTPGVDVTVEYLAEHAEVITALAKGSATIGLLPEPNVTSALGTVEGLRIAVNMTEAWDAVSTTTLAQGCVIVRTEFAEKYPDAVKTFLREYAESVAYVNANPEEASAMIEAQGIIPKAALAKKAIPTSNICLITGDEVKTILAPLYDVFLAANPASIGGTLPDDAFYYNQK